MSEPVLPETTSDESEVGWGDGTALDDREVDDEERLNSDRPPHHDRS